jgi:hypothetical protein
MRSKQEIICPHCKQLNIRYTGWSAVLNPLVTPELCLLCGTNLYTGKREALFVAFAYLTFVAVLGLYALIGIMLCVLPYLFFISYWPLSDPWVRTLGAAAMLLGGGTGLWVANRARRRGELLHGRRQKGG